ncbi:MAG TPA: Trm112 family protein [Longimicrobium sp.]|nr:Trm112 family protein [Longimicrobium sp.]
MHILLTDFLTCPRCGPELGLILLADRIQERRVERGSLGCANCRATYPIRGGAADLRLSADPTPGALPAPAGDPAEPALRLAALMGLAEARGPVLVAGPGAVLAPALSTLVPEIEVVAFTPEPPDTAPPGNVSPVAGAGALPFRPRAFRGVALTGDTADALLPEALRVLQPGARVVVDPAPPGTADRAAALGAAVLLDQEGVVVARALGEPVPLRMNAIR